VQGARIIPFWLLALYAFGAPLASGQRLPIRQYGVADGLAQNQVVSILQDRRGFLWFGSWEGLSRFDGRRFVNYGLDDGLPHAVVNSLSEDPSGRLWVGTSGGLATLIEEAAPGDRSRFRPHGAGLGPENTVLAVVFEPDGRPWCLTRSGLYRGREERDLAWTFERALSGAPGADSTQTALADPQGRLWFGVLDTLVSVSQGRVERHLPPAALRGGDILGLLERAPGRILVAFKHDVLEFTAASASWSWMDLELEDNELTGPLARNARGVLFVGTRGGLLRIEGEGQRLYTAEEGLAQDYVGALAVDREGDLWIGHGAKGSGRGLSRLLDNGIQSWTQREGLPEPSTLGIAVSADGRVHASTEDSGLFEILDDGRIRTVPGSRGRPLDEAQRRLAQDARGDWWMGTQRSLFRFAGPALRIDHGSRRFTAADGFAGVPVDIHADPQGGVSVATADGSFYRFDPERPQPERSRIDPSPPGAQVQSFLHDHQGRLWLGLRHHGLSMTADPSVPVPRWTSYSTRNGLASNAVWCLAEDARGRIYAGTSRGLDRLDPETGRVRHFKTSDGLPGDVVNDCTVDAGGHLWLALQGGVARLDPEARPPLPRGPSVYLTRVAVAGAEVPLPERGTPRLDGLELPAARNSLVIDYLAPGADEVSYQYRLENVDREWSAPSPTSSVHYARLPPGRYRFTVRALLAEGVPSAEPALLEFRVAPPFWRRGWFLALMGALALAAALGAHRVRVGRVLALQRVRTQIASDLHDDLGSGLGSIGILAGLSAEGGLAEEEQRSLARRIAETAAEMGSVLSDIVWTLRRDTASLEALGTHLAERAARLFPLPPPEFQTRFPDEWPEVELSLIARRSLLLIALESLHNAARHAQASRVTLGVEVKDSRLRLWVEDDGRGFATHLPADPDRGMGLTNMRRRAGEAKAEIDFRPRPGGGTVIDLSMRLGR
jgi:ligand-binding sensor domain-containing protein/signal transduction histidine kinase